jgi:hypothetical protein
MRNLFRIDLAWLRRMPGLPLALQGLWAWVVKIGWVRTTLGLTAVSTTFGVLGNFAGVGTIASSIACPVAADFCGSVGVTGWPTRKERLAWQALQSKAPSCEALVQYHKDFPDGVYTGRVVNAYSLRTFKKIEVPDTEAESWPPMSVYVGDLASSQAGAATEASEKIKLLARADGVARATCSTLNGILVSYKLSPTNWNCQKVAGGVSCGLKALATCSVRGTESRQVGICNRP